MTISAEQGTADVDAKPTNHRKAGSRIRPRADSADGAIITVRKVHHSLQVVKNGYHDSTHRGGLVPESCNNNNTPK
jgi:hypothetical protein